MYCIPRGERERYNIETRRDEGVDGVVIQLNYLLLRCNLNSILLRLHLRMQRSAGRHPMTCYTYASRMRTSGVVIFNSV